MIYVSENGKQKIKDITKDNFYVIADFDQTITSKKSSTTFSLFSKSGLYPDSYLMERNKNYEYYRPLELDPGITDEQKFLITKAWQEASYNLMVKYKVKESDISKILYETDLLEIRKEAPSFINYLNENDIPLIISSAGVGNFIIELLKKYTCYNDGIYIHSNMFQFKDDEIIDTNPEIIHSMNKTNINLPKSFKDRIKDKKYAIIVGDQISDLKMTNNLPKSDVLSFGFLESNVDELEGLFKENFDVVLTGNEGFGKISKILKFK